MDEETNPDVTSEARPVLPITVGKRELFLGGRMGHHTTKTLETLSMQLSVTVCP